MIRMETPSIADLPQHLSDKDRTIWVDLEAPDEEEVGVLGGIFGFHVLAAEDSIQGHYLPKIDFYDTCVFVVLHAVDLPELEQGFQSIEVSFFLGERFLVTHHAKQVKGIFDARGQVAKNPGSLLRSTDWLLHHIVDAMIDHYDTALSSLGTRISQIEQTRDAFVAFCALKTELSHLRRLGRLQQAVIERLAHENRPWILKAHHLYFQNIHAHMVRVVQTADFYEDRLEAAVRSQEAYERAQQTRSFQRLVLINTVFLPLFLLALLIDVDLIEWLELSPQISMLLGLGVLAMASGGIVGFLKWKRWF
jgi:magnesium transporter